MTTPHRHFQSGRTGTALGRAGTLAGAALLVAACAEPLTSPSVESSALSAEPASAAQQMTTMVRTHPSLGPAVPIEGASAKLVSNNNGVTVVLHTADLVPGNAYTVWWVKVDKPENCATTPCGGPDVIGNSAVVSANVAFAAGHLAGGNGQATFAAHFTTGAVPGGWFDNEFTNPTGADIHLVVMEHGPAIPGLISNQTSTLRGGCTDESVNTPPISGFPAVAKADGIPGPNTCRLVQIAIFVQ